MVGSIKDHGECGLLHPHHDGDDQRKQQHVELHTDWVMLPLPNDDSHNSLHNADADDGEDNTGGNGGLYEDDMLNCL